MGYVGERAEACIKQFDCGLVFLSFSGKNGYNPVEAKIIPGSIPKIPLCQVFQHVYCEANDREWIGSRDGARS